VSGPGAPSPAPVDPSPEGSLQRLRALLLGEGGLMASLVDAAAGSGDRGETSGPAQLAATGPLTEGSHEDYELLVEAIYEGYLLHYGTPRVAVTPDDDLALLAGDRLYALGLSRLVALGDIPAVAELADTISLAALARGADAPELAEAVWAAGARAVGWGSSDAHRRAKALALAGAPEAFEAMRTISDRPPPILAAPP
jgi:hypothetical protein